MRTLLTLLLILLLTSAGLTQIAVITDIKTGDPASEKMIKAIYENINRAGSIKQVIFIGDLTANGTISELETFGKSLESLNPDDYILPGKKDIMNNPSSYLYIRDQFDGTRIRLDSAGLFLAGLANYSIHGTQIGFSSNDLKWLDSLFNAVNKNNKLLFFTTAPLNLSDNWIPVYNLLTTRSSKFILSSGTENKITTFKGIEQITFKPSIEKTGWNYNVIYEQEDSLRFMNVAGDTSASQWGSVSVSGKELTFPIDTQYALSYGPEITLKKETGKDLPSPVLPTEDRIFTISLNGEAEAMDYTGKTIWKINLARTVVTKPFRDRDVVIAGTVEGDLFSINANNGDIVQVIGTDEPIICDPVMTDVINMDGKYKAIVIGSPSGKITCYDIYTFQLLWEINSAKNKINYMTASEGKLFFTSSDGYLYSADLSNGNLIWKWNPGKNISITSHPKIGNKYIYIACTNKLMFAIDLLLGTTAWKKTDFGQSVTIHLTDNKKEIIVKSIKDEVITADALSGKIIKKIKTGFELDNTPSFITEETGNILFTSRDGIVRKIGADNTTENIFYLGGGTITNFTKTPKGNYLISNDKGVFVLFSF